MKTRRSIVGALTLFALATPAAEAAIPTDHDGSFQTSMYAGMKRQGAHALGLGARSEAALKAFELRLEASTGYFTMHNYTHRSGVLPVRDRRQPGPGGAGV
jgi:hypothetical protein